MEPISILLYGMLTLILLMLYRLLTTNHWTTGKRILVGLVGSLGWKYVFFLQPFLIFNPIFAVLICEAPLFFTLLATIYLFYFEKEKN